MGGSCTQWQRSAQGFQHWERVDFLGSRSRKVLWEWQGNGGKDLWRLGREVPYSFWRLEVELVMLSNTTISLLLADVHKPPVIPRENITCFGNGNREFSWSLEWNTDNRKVVGEILVFILKSESRISPRYIVVSNHFENEVPFLMCTVLEIPHVSVRILTGSRWYSQTG